MPILITPIIQKAGMRAIIVEASLVALPLMFERGTCTSAISFLFLVLSSSTDRPCLQHRSRGTLISSRKLIRSLTSRMVQNNISSALILESDADWDVRIHEIMQPAAKGIQTLVDWPFTIEHHNVDQQLYPYGDSWDILWIGHCGSNRDGNVRAYAWNDTSVPPENHEWSFDLGLTSEQHTPGTRTVFQFGRTTCTTGYAISNAGAHKLVKYFQETDENVDNKLSSVCSSRVDMTCLGVWPQIISAAETKSNIDHGEGDDIKALKPIVKAGPALQYSARVNSLQIMKAGGYVPKQQWVGEWDTAWGINPVKNGTWDLMKLNKTSGEPIFDLKKIGDNDDYEETETSNSRVRRALLQG